MLKDIFEMTDAKSKVTIRVFFLENGIKQMTYHDVAINSDNVDAYDEIFTVSTIVPMDGELLIEGTI